MLALLARLAKDVQAEFADQSRLLGDGDELTGIDHAPARVVPAHQSLDTDRPAGGDVHDRLIEEAELAPLDGPFEVAAYLQPARGNLLHAGLEDLEAALALHLGAIHGHVGAAYELLGADIA